MNDWHIERFWSTTFEQWQYQAFQAGHYGLLTCCRCGNMQDGDFWGTRCMNCSDWIGTAAVERVTKLLGRCWVLVRPDQPAMLSGLYVEPVWRGQGIAGTLLAQVLTDYAAVGVRAHADPFGRSRGLSRHALCAFYRRHGATITRTGLCTWPLTGRTPHEATPTG